MATKARLHWFWRGMIAWLAGLAGIILGFLTVQFVLALAGVAGGATYVIIRGIGFLAVPLPSIVIYSLLSRRFGPPSLDGELHCRRCDHILRGLSEPRCPECGERI